MRFSISLLLAMTLTPMLAPAAQAQDAPVYVVSYIEVAPTAGSTAAALLRQLATNSRKEPGATRFEVFQQTSRPNHFTVVEIWKDQNAYDAHITAAHTKKFREQLTPMSGALYDERLYKAL